MYHSIYFAGGMDIPDESGTPQSEAGVRITKHCINCGAEIDINAAMCPKCGVMQNKKPIGKSKIFCYNCGAEIDINAVICPSCGVKQKTAGSLIQNISGSTTEELRSDPVLDKSPTTAVIMGLLGLLPGYWYIGRLWKRGVVVIILGLLLSFTGIGVFIVWGAGIYDIYKHAKNEPAPFDILNKWDLG